MNQSGFFRFIIALEGFKRDVKSALLAGFEACFQLQVTLENFLDVFRPQPRYLKCPPSVDLQGGTNYMTHRHFKHIIFAIRSPLPRPTED